MAGRRGDAGRGRAGRAGTRTAAAALLSALLVAPSGPALAQGADTPAAPTAGDPESLTLAEKRRLVLEFLRRAQEAYQRPPPLLPGQGTTLDGLAPGGMNAIPDGEELLLSLHLGRTVLGGGLIGVKQGDTVLLPLEDFVAALEFPIEVGADGRAEGWFLSEDRRFRLDPDTRIAEVVGLEEPVPDGAIDRLDGVLLVDARLLDRWFGIGLRLDVREQVVHLAPRTPLPLQARLARRERGVPQGLAGPGEAQFPPAALPYRPAVWPFVDLSLLAQAERARGGSVRPDGLFSAVGGGDLGFARSSFVIAGTEDRLETARLTLGRQDPAGGLLGPLRATSWEVGEVLATRLAVAGSSIFERGLRITNEPVDSAGSLDRTDLLGDLQPGWDVELYRNGALIGFSSAGAEGRYEFRDVPLFLGINDFRLVYYGPQGQVREETRSVPVGLGLAAPGQFLYDLSLTERTRPLFRLDGVAAPAGGPRAVATGSYGIAEGISLGLGLDANRHEGDRYTVVQGNLVMRHAGLLTSTGYARDLEGGQAVEGVAQARLLGHDLRLRGQWLDGYRLAAGLPARDEVQAEASLRGQLRHHLAWPGLYEVTADLRHDKGGRRQSRLAGRLVLSMAPSSLGQTLAVRQLENAPDAGTSLEGTTQLSTAIGDLRLRGVAEYRLAPTPELLNSSATLSFPLSPSVRGELGVLRSEQADLTSGIARATWTTGWGVVGPVVTYDSAGRLTAGVQLSLSAAREPRGGGIHLSPQRLGNSGGVSARVFLDVDRDGTFGPGDRPIPNALVLAPQAYRSAATDEDGVAFLIGLPENRPTDIVLDGGTLDDPHWTVVGRGYAVTPRLGVVQDLDFPVVTSGEVEGTVHLTAADGTDQPARRVEMLLRREDGSIADRQQTEFDGFFLFTGVAPGRYRLEVAPEALERTGTPVRYSRALTIPPDGDTLAVGDIRLGPGAAKALARSASRGTTTRFGVEVGAYGSRFGALADLVVLYGQAPDLARRLTLAEGEVPRLHAPDLGDLAAAERACQRLRSPDRPCLIVALDG